MIFNGDIGRITFPEDLCSGQRPAFEKDVVCEKCGVLTLDEVELTELGQTQLTEIHFESF
jgi:hypothetical protein